MAASTGTLGFAVPTRGQAFTVNAPAIYVTTGSSLGVLAGLTCSLALDGVAAGATNTTVQASNLAGVGCDLSVAETGYRHIGYTFFTTTGGVYFPMNWVYPASSVGGDAVPGGTIPVKGYMGSNTGDMALVGTTLSLMATTLALSSAAAAAGATTLSTIAAGVAAGNTTLGLLQGSMNVAQGQLVTVQTTLGLLSATDVLQSNTLAQILAKDNGIATTLSQVQSTINGLVIGAITVDLTLTNSTLAQVLSSVTAGNATLGLLQGSENVTQGRIAAANTTLGLLQTSIGQVEAHIATRSSQTSMDASFAVVESLIGSGSGSGSGGVMALSSIENFQTLGPMAAGTPTVALTLAAAYLSWSGQSVPKYTNAWIWGVQGGSVTMRPDGNAPNGTIGFGIPAQQLLTNTVLPATGTLGLNLGVMVYGTGTLQLQPGQQAPQAT